MLVLPWIPESLAPSDASSREASLAKRVRDEVLASILKGELQAGQRINEPDVAARLKVSRVPVREALRELESTGLVSSRRHAGVFVRHVAPKEVADLYDMRSVLDGHAGRRAASLAPGARRPLVKTLRAHAKTMKACARLQDTQGYYNANLAFHWAIVEAADNAVLADAYQRVVQQLHLSRLKNLSRTSGVSASLEEHDRIIKALSAGDAQHCQSLLIHHVTASHARLTADPADSSRPLSGDTP